MHKLLNWLQQLSNRFFAIPAVTQWWSHRAAARTEAQTEAAAAAGGPPFAMLRKPLAQCRVALITTAGVHLRWQTPFDTDNPDGDATYRAIGAAAEAGDLMITHKYYNHSDADRDLNVVFPLAHLRDLVSRGVLGSLASHHFGLMGHIDGAQLPILTGQSAPALAAALQEDGVDFVLLTPA